MESATTYSDRQRFFWAYCRKHNATWSGLNRSSYREAVRGAVKHRRKHGCQIEFEHRQISKGVWQSPAYLEMLRKVPAT